MTISSPRTSSRTYRRSPYSAATVCAIRPATRLLIRDSAAWETFDASDLTEYLFDGAAKAAAHIERIAYLDHPYTKQDEKSLTFMVDALLHARRVADETTR